MSCISLAPINRIYSLHAPTTFHPHISTANRRTRKWRCQVTNEETNQDVKTEDKSNKVVDTVVPDKRINRRIGLASISAAVGLFLSTRGWFGGVIPLSDLSVSAVPYDEALTNGRPTMVEFYADWCEVCRELAPDVYKVEKEFKDKVNFVMLNVDNTKWEEEIDEFGVEGIPHFSFLDKDGNEEGNVVGRIPKQYLAENLAALVRGDKKIPHARFVGKFSKAESREVHPVANPRGHSNT
ncbi:hypothetical protein SUGI_0609700 [Cryptomeria japonica]|uniref:thioredoxin-like protein HCF164, chloroplastic n=1 Tax=Cryptomeria japonica TaxID=3369 RepID=UPI002414AD8B|nr:thioredoxin-like protein HCF164, chloroplastic [Cryptomeria japonica]GLJ30753.1 hypothetical protein SUGI_0609700 [Cryptomeria japonica]